ncbi:MAG TPA: GGDEF domain-containing protein, partial [Acidimicrobiales bacterium]|nr:GGDEF domain-containing protein [Acidimicrobiales bacterium]
TLTRVGGALQETVRAEDLVVRLGGDEFAVVLSDTDLVAASVRAKAILDRLHDEPWPELAPGLTISVSLGVTAGDPSDVRRLRQSADQALYEAKAAGGDRVVGQAAAAPVPSPD